MNKPRRILIISIRSDYPIRIIIDLIRRNSDLFIFQSEFQLMQILFTVQMRHLQVRVRVIFECSPIILIRCKRDEALHCYLCAAAVATVILTGSPCPSAISHAFPSGKDYVSAGLRLTQVKARTSIVVTEAATRHRKYLTSADGSANMEGWSGRIVRNADAPGREGYAKRPGAT